MHSYMMDGTKIPIHKQMFQLNIYQRHIEVWCEMKSIATRYNKYLLEYLIDEIGHDIDNYNY